MHKPRNIAVSIALAGMVAAALVAGCGGGGGGYVATPGGGGHPSPSPSPGPSAGIEGQLNVTTGGTYPGPWTTSAAANDTVIFTCGCSNQAGTTTTDASGNFAVVSPASPTPASPNPTYTIVPTRNYLVIAEPPATLAGPQAWTMIFAGSDPSRDLALGDAGAVAASSGMSDVYTTAAALYVYKFSTQASNRAFDAWNFNTVQSWVQALVTSPTALDTTLLNDIASQSGGGHSLFPSMPGWNSAQPLNAGKINQDLRAIHDQSPPDPAVPTPCPGGEGNCTGTPTP